MYIVEYKLNDRYLIHYKLEGLTIQEIITEANRQFKNSYITNKECASG